MVLRQAGRHALGPNPTKLELPYRSRCQDSESPQPHLEDGSVYRARWWTTRTSVPKGIRFSTSVGAVDDSRREPLGPLFNIQAAQGAHSSRASTEL